MPRHAWLFPPIRRGCQARGTRHHFLTGAIEVFEKWSKTTFAVECLYKYTLPAKLGKVSMDFLRPEELKVSL